MLGHRAHGTSTPTAVVHEAYAKLAIAGSVPDVTERAFKRLAAHVMREVLCDAARRRLAGKRGGKNAIRVSLDDQLSVKVRAAAVFELAYFGGLTIPEVAKAMEVSESTAERDWRFARAWLAPEVRRSSAKPAI